MLQVWKIEIPSRSVNEPIVHGWALAESAEEAKEIAGDNDAKIIQKPEHLWISSDNVVWED